MLLLVLICLFSKSVYMPAFPLQVHMVIDGDMEGVVNESVDPSSVNLVVHEVPEVRQVVCCEIWGCCGNISQTRCVDTRQCLSIGCGVRLYLVCRRDVDGNSIPCIVCSDWVHGRCIVGIGSLNNVSDLTCSVCIGGNEQWSLGLKALVLEISPFRCQ